MGYGSSPGDLPLGFIYYRQVDQIFEFVTLSYIYYVEAAQCLKKNTYTTKHTDMAIISVM